MGQVIVQVVDNAMVGRLGAAPLAAVSFAGSIFILVFIVGIGITMGATPLVGERYARGNYRASAALLQNATVLYILAGVALFAILLALVPLIPHLGQPPEVIEMAVEYYKYLAWSVIPFMIFGAFKQFLEGIGNTRVAMAIVLLSNVINVIFNWLLIYGNWGFPAMGVAGAGLATLISRILTPVLIIIYFLRRDSFRRYFRFFHWKNLQFKWIRRLLKVGLPISSQMFMEVSAFALSSIMMGWIGTVELAANQIAMTMASFAFMIVVGLSSAATIRSSHACGTGNLRELRRVTNASYRIGIIYSLSSATLFIVLRRWIPFIFTSDPAVAELASYLLVFVALFQISDALQTIMIGILRGIKDVNATMAIAFVSYLLVNLPVGYLCAFVLDWGAGGLWVGFVVGLTLAAVLLNLRYRYTYRRMWRAASEKSKEITMI